NVNFDIVTNDNNYIGMVKRILSEYDEHLIFVACMGCGEQSAPTTDNLPMGWHMKCWLKCLDKDPEAAHGYTIHLEKELAPRIHKLFPKLQPHQFRELYETCADIFWLQLYNLKTRGKHINQRLNDPKQTYSGICSFSLEQMKKDSNYFKYILDLMYIKHYWHERDIKYSCITYKSFMEYVQKQANKTCNK
ncbi:MAG: hypothetical protein ACPG2Y_00080, partial [Acholeplasmataceae bacterium]